jgi:hypothetical protein
MKAGEVLNFQLNLKAQ